MTKKIKFFLILALILPAMLFSGDFSSVKSEAETAIKISSKDRFVSALSELKNAHGQPGYDAILEIAQKTSLTPEFKTICGVFLKTSARYQAEQPPQQPARQQQKPICFASHTGNRYHSKADCSGKCEPIFDLATVKQRGLTPCKKCWNKEALVK